MGKKKNSLSDKLTSTKLVNGDMEGVAVSKEQPAGKESRKQKPGKQTEGNFNKQMPKDLMAEDKSSRNKDRNEASFKAEKPGFKFGRKKTSLKDKLVNTREEDLAKEKGDTVVTRSSIEEQKKEIEKEIENDFKNIQLDNDRREKRWRLSTRVINIALILGCVYMIFLIYGVFVTDYAYNDDGRIKPQVMTVEDIKKEKEFEKLVAQYVKCRMLYEKVLMINYRLGEGTEDPLVIAPEYQALLEKGDVNVSDIAIKLNALEVDPKYETIKNMLLNWIQNDAALYLQFISGAISNNDADAAVSAIQYKDLMYDDFSKITQNLIAIGDNIKGIDITDVKEWTPESYVDKQVNGE